MPGRYAVVIGINYRNFPATMDQEAQSRAGINALNYAEADAVAMAALLTKDGYDVVELVGPAASRAEIIDALKEQSRKAGPEGLLLVHYSGHGALDPDDHELAYLLPADADPEEMHSTAIPLDSVARYYLGHTQSALVILDCCHSGYAVGLKSGDKDVVLNSEAAEFSQQAGQTFKRVLGRVTIAACAGQQLAREREDLKHGVLTHYVLKHWHESSEIVDDFSIYRYLAKRMPAHGVPAPVRGGTPQQGVIELRPARPVEVDYGSGSEEAAHTVEAEPPYNPPPVMSPQPTPSTRAPIQQNQTISKGPDPNVSRWIIPGSIVALIIIGMLGFLIIGPPRPNGPGIEATATPPPTTSVVGSVPTLPPPATATPIPPIPATATPVSPILPTGTPVPLTAVFKINLGNSVRGLLIQGTCFENGTNTTVILTGVIYGDDWNTEDLLEDLSYKFDGIGQVPEGSTVCIIPVLNMDGYAFGSHYNAEGVDLNRNWSTRNWSANIESGGDVIPLGGGKYRFSEPETTAYATWLGTLKEDGRRIIAINYYNSLTTGKVRPSYRIVYTRIVGNPDTVTSASMFASKVGYIYFPDSGTIPTNPITGEFINWCGEANINCFDVTLPTKDSLGEKDVQKQMDAIKELLTSPAGTQ